MYLGDGDITRARGRCFRLRITTDATHPGVIEECRRAIQEVVPRNRVAVRPRKDGTRAVEVSAYSNSWPCLIPQHGAGKKHRRSIQLAPWQQEIVDREPEKFLRGLIHSDGCRVLNRVGDRVYPRYFFSQRSVDIQEIFMNTCRAMGIHVTLSGRQISVSRHSDVALLDTFVGAKT